MIESVESDTGTKEEIVESSDRDKKVTDWRTHQFTGMGFSVKVATTLGQTQVDTWQARHLLEQGCTPTLAVRILVGITRTGDEDIGHSLHWFLAEVNDIEYLASSLEEVPAA